MAEKWEIEERKMIRRLRREKRRKSREAKETKRKRAPPKPKHEEYRDRRIVLQQLGFNSYGEYLNSELWADIRRRVIERDEGRCGACRMFASEQVHHIRYDYATLSGGSLDQLVSVCGRCHRQIEFDRKGRKRTLKRAQQATRHRMKNTE